MIEVGLRSGEGSAPNEVRNACAWSSPRAPCLARPTASANPSRPPPPGEGPCLYTLSISLETTTWRRLWQTGSVPPSSVHLRFTACSLNEKSSRRSGKGMVDRRSLLCAERQWNDRQRSQEFLSSRVSPPFPFIYRCRWVGSWGAFSMPRTSTAGWSPQRRLSSLVSPRVAGFLFCYCCCCCFVFNLSVCVCVCVWACKRVLDSCVYCITIYKTKTKTNLSRLCRDPKYMQLLLLYC